MSVRTALPRGAGPMAGVLLLGTASLGPWAVGPRSAAPSWPTVLCSEAARPRSEVNTLRSEPLAGVPGRWITVQLIRYKPRALTPAHVHGGDLTAYVLEGVVRSEHAGLPAADYAVGQTIHEPLGSTHVFIENPSLDQPASILAIIVHEQGAALTTFLD